MITLFICISPIWPRLLHTKHFFCDRVYSLVLLIQQKFISRSLNYTTQVTAFRSVLPHVVVPHTGWENFPLLITWLSNLLSFHLTSALPSSSHRSRSCLARAVRVGPKTTMVEQGLSVAASIRKNGETLLPRKQITGTFYFQYR